ncbi:ankyrin [Thraustotheca clavata]|uniref:Ankyrin n=1 Tax=Thraustotheca clavata TaxID=74557 RepID=A0A1V9YVH5_9STRA|nr:ankyrin [Thraustotheca clavata]
MGVDAYNRLETAILDHQHDVINELIAHVNVNAYSYRYHGKTLLHQATAIDDMVCVEKLLQRRAKVHCFDENDATPLHFVCSVDVARLLLENGASVKIKRSDGATPLHTCRSVEIAKELVLHGALVSVVTNNGDSPLHFVKCSKLAEYFVQIGSDVNAENRLGYSPLHIASSFGRWQIAAVLLSNGASPDTKDRMMRTSKMIAQAVRATFNQAAMRHGMVDPLSEDLLYTIRTIDIWKDGLHKGLSPKQITRIIVWKSLQAICKNPEAAMLRIGLPQDIIDTIFVEYLGPWAIKC